MLIEGHRALIRKQSEVSKAADLHGCPSCGSLQLLRTTQASWDEGAITCHLAIEWFAGLCCKPAEECPTLLTRTSRVTPVAVPQACILQNQKLSFEHE